MHSFDLLCFVFGVHQCKGLGPGVLAYTVDNSAHCWTDNYDKTSIWPYPSLFFVSPSPVPVGFQITLTAFRAASDLTHL
jgi:hypothetical protein